MALKMKYFVLKPAGGDQYAEASRFAMMEYSRKILSADPELAASLSDWVHSEKMRLLEEGDSQTPTNSAMVEIAARMEEFAKSPCQEGYVPIFPDTLRKWARQLRQ